MSELDKQAEQIEKDWKTFRGLCEKLRDRTEAVLKMVDFFEERLLFCPASSKKQFHCSFEGGLLNHSLRVAQNIIKINKTFNLNLPQESLLLVALFHDFGKIGNLDEANYLPQESDWHIKKGFLYNFNESIQYMTYSDRTLFLFQHFGINLTEDEFVSLRASDGPFPYENKPYNMKEPLLCVVLQMADRMACEQEKLLGL